jgi:anti-sigma factor RsiW
MNLDKLRLMHEVLDGEASADDARELDRLLATDTEARAEYEALRCLFEGLNAMSKAVLPEGMVAETLARIPSRPKVRHRLRQLSSRWRVFVSDSRRPRTKSPARGARTQRNFQGEHNNRNADMNKRNLWIGAGVAAVAVIVASRYFDFPSSSDMSGTIAPANRSVAAQPGAADMTAAPQGDVVATSVTVADDASRDGSRDAVRDSSRDATRDANRDAVRDSSRDATRDANRDAVRDSSKDATRDANRDAVRDSSKDATRDANRDAVRDSSKDATRDANRDAVRDSSKDATRDANRDAVRDSSRDAARDANRDAVRDASVQQ